MSESDKKVEFIIEAIDKSEATLKESAKNINQVTNATLTLQNASDKYLKTMIAQIRSERSEVQQTVPVINKLTDAHVKNETVARRSLSQQFDYSRRLTSQFNELATRILGIGGAYAVFRYLTNSLKDAGLNTDQFQGNLDKVSATIGNELLPLAENGMKWFNENYQVITQTVLNFGKTFQVVFGGITSLPIGAAAAFYKMRPAIDYALGIRGEALEKSRKEAKTLGASYAESFKSEIDKMQQTIMSMSDLPEMKTPKKKTGTESFDKYAQKVGLPSQTNIDFVIKQAEEEKKIASDVQSWYQNINEEQTNDAQKQFENMQKLRNDAKESKISTISDEYERELAALELWKQQEIATYGYSGEQKLLIDQMVANKKEEIELKSFENSKKLSEKERMMKLNNFYAIAGGFNDLMGAISSASKESAKSQKAIAIVQATINTAVSATKALSDVPYPLNYVVMAMNLAAGAVQIATIASQNFALGGIAKRVPGAVSDSVNINVNPDERIMTKRQQNNLTKFLNNPNNQSSGDTFNIYDSSGDLVETFISKIRSGAADKFISAFNVRTRYAIG